MEGLTNLVTEVSRWWRYSTNQGEVYFAKFCLAADDATEKLVVGVLLGIDGLEHKIEAQTHRCMDAFYSKIPAASAKVQSVLRVSRAAKEPAVRDGYNDGNAGRQV